MTARCKHAEALEVRPDVAAWVRRLRRLVRDTPAGVRVYVANATVTVTDNCDGAGEDAQAIQQHSVESIGAPRWNAGDF